MNVPSRFSKISEWLEETDDYGDIQLYKNDTTGIALLYINNPSKRNALTGEIMSKFSKLIGELEEWKNGKALIVYGSRNFFCSGLNLNLVKQIIGREWHSTQMALLMTDNFKRLRNLPLITIALVEGKALGGGAEFCTNLDMRIFTDSAQVGFVHKKMGISTAWTGAISLTKLLGPFKAIEILLSARLIGAEEAFKLGLANYVITSIRTNSATNDGSNIIYQFNQSPSTINGHCCDTNQSEQPFKIVPVVDGLKQQLGSIVDQSPLIEHHSNKQILINKQSVSNENRTNYCKKIFKRLKKKDEDKDEKLTKRCKLDVDDKRKPIKKIEKDAKSIKKCNESSKMLKRMKRILFDVEEKFVIKPEIEMSSCSEDDELERIQKSNDSLSNSNVIKSNDDTIKMMEIAPPSIDYHQPQQPQVSQFIHDGQTNYKVGLSDEDDNTILNLVYNWLARLTACLDQNSWSELKQLVREQQRSSESVDLLNHLNLKLFNHKTNQTTNKCIETENKINQWKVLKSINSVANQTV